MKCPFCGYKKDKVMDSRLSRDGKSIRRRRECLKCKKRYTTHEYLEETSLLVIKKDGRRAQFDRKKILSGIIKACEKRPVSLERMEAIVTSVERSIYKDFDKEVSSRVIGEFVMERLAKLDDVAYVRFASVYRQFKDVNQFMKELKGMLGKRSHNRRS
ncbi:transcriptional repressor NrdR [bacterium]|nr:transcriptional repressor NrdR [bacterium]